MEPFLLSTILIRIIAILLIGSVLGGAFALGRYLRFGRDRRVDEATLERLARLEAAVERMATESETAAVELERIAEGQRFLTKLLSRGDGGTADRSVPTRAPVDASPSAIPKHITPT